MDWIRKLVSGMPNNFTQVDAQIEGINSDINTYNKAVRECNKYGEFLAKKYCIDIDEGLQRHYHISSALHRSKNYCLDIDVDICQLQITNKTSSIRSKR